MCTKMRMGDQMYYIFYGICSLKTRTLVHIRGPPLLKLFVSTQESRQRVCWVWSHRACTETENQHSLTLCVRFSSARLQPLFGRCIHCFFFSIQLDNVG